MLVGRPYASTTLLAALLVVGGAAPAAAQGTLWLGNDHTPPALHVNPDGSVVNSIPENVTGFAYDGAHLYSASAFSMQMTRRNAVDGSDPVLLAANPDTCASTCEDMAFDGTSIWRIEHFNATIHRIDPATGDLLESIPLTATDPDGTLDPLGGYGIAWDGSVLWLSFGPQDGACEPAHCGAIFTYDVTAGVLTHRFSTDFVPGGLAFDPAGDLWVGGYGSTLQRMDTSGTVLETISVAEGVAFSDGLEFVPDLQPNLRVTAVSDPPATAVLRGKFAVTDTTQNDGGAAAGASTTRYYLSLDTARSGSDKALAGLRKVPALSAGSAATGTKTVTVPAGAKTGTYYLLACADATGAVAESSEADNCAASASTVIVRAPNLVVTALSPPPASAPKGSVFLVSDTVRNTGDAAAGPSTSRYYLSLDTKKSGTDTLLTGSRGVGGLGIGATSPGSVSVSVPLSAPSGTCFVLACADDLKKVAESSEKDNCRASATTVAVP